MTPEQAERLRATDDFARRLKFGGTTGPRDLERALGGGMLQPAPKAPPTIPKRKS